MIQQTPSDLKSFVLPVDLEQWRKPCQSQRLIACGVPEPDLVVPRNVDVVGHGIGLTTGVVEKGAEVRSLTAPIPSKRHYGARRCAKLEILLEHHDRIFFGLIKADSPDGVVVALADPNSAMRHTRIIRDASLTRFERTCAGREHQNHGKRRHAARKQPS